ncbi:hypothetical protein [Marinoscillum sp. MHG1-6]|uniref:hypothetical protein n=1 Tax=Marinoscillum sp. MHG1-6 TaxID=2959627 RepID=UPI0021584D4B|nr:hypothetical protein [Marinoscillum sp. MHG1-6]
MNKIVLLKTGVLNPTWARIIFCGISAFYLYVGWNKFTNQEGLFESLFFVAGDLFFLFYAVVILSNTSITPRFEIRDNQVIMRKTLFSNTVILGLQEVRKINLGSYRIDFELSTGNEVFEFRSNDKVSINLKNALREVGDKFDIPVKEVSFK